MLGGDLGGGGVLLRIAGWLLRLAVSCVLVCLLGGLVGWSVCGGLRGAGGMSWSLSVVFWGWGVR